MSSGGGGGGVNLDRVWKSLTNNTDKPNVTINSAHIPVATTSAIGGVKVDGTTITINNGVISSTGDTGGGVSSLNNLTGAIALANGNNVSITKRGQVISIAATDTLYKLTLNGTVNGASGGTSLGTLFAPTTAGTRGYELLSAGSGNMPVWSRRGNAQHNTTAQNASEEWVKVATIGFTTGYKDQPIKLFVSQRRRQGAILTIRFTPAVFPNMEVESFTYDGVLDGARLAGSGGTWSLYIKKEENYDAVALTLVNIGVHQNNGMTWTWEDTPTATADLPAGTDATLFRPSYYIGQTQVQTSSANQALAGISGINSVLAFNTNDITVSKPILPSGSIDLGNGNGHEWRNIYSNYAFFDYNISIGNNLIINGEEQEQGDPVEISVIDVGLYIHNQYTHIILDDTDITIGGMPVIVDDTLRCYNQLQISGQSNNNPQLLFTKSNDRGYLRFENLGDSQNPKLALRTDVGLVTDSFLTSTQPAASSDARLKDNIVEVSPERALSILSALRGVEWDWNNKVPAFEGKHGSGLVAQEVQKVMPWAVLDLNGELSLNYNSFWGMAISVLQSHEERLRQAEKRIADLEARVEELEKRILYESHR